MENPQMKALWIFYVNTCLHENVYIFAKQIQHNDKKNLIYYHNGNKPLCLGTRH